MISCRFLQIAQYQMTESMRPLSVSHSMCQLELHYTGIKWEQCQQTPFDGPCWQMREQFKTTEEWQAWVQVRLSQL